MVPFGLSHYSVEMVNGLCPEVIEIIEPTREGYQLTLRLNFNNIPHRKGLANCFLTFVKLYIRLLNVS